MTETCRWRFCTGTLRPESWKFIPPPTLTHSDWATRSVNFPGSPAEKFGRWEKISGPLQNLAFWRHLAWWKFCYLCLRAREKYNISLICTELDGIKGDNFILRNPASFWPFLSKIENRPKFGRSFVPPLYYFLFGSFWVILPNNRPVSSTDDSWVVRRARCQLFGSREGKVGGSNEFNFCEIFSHKKQLSAPNTRRKLNI